MNESQLVHEYSGNRSDDAFRALVDQYVGLVYLACFRQLKDRHLAEDATQAVFFLLSQKARALPQAHLSGWLLTTSRYACANIRRSEQRRQHREQVVAMRETTTNDDSSSDDLLELLDRALLHLKAHDRQALILRYLEEQPISDIAEKLGVSPEAARKRINRGIEKLRGYFSRHGITTTSPALGAILAEQFTGSTLTASARHNLTQGIFQIIRAGAQSTSAGIAIAKGTKSMMIMTNLKNVAAMILISAFLGLTGWMISHALAKNATAPQIATPIAPATSKTAPATSTTAPPAQPNTELSPLDLSTPESTARSFFVAIKNGDRASAYACLTADPNRPPNLLDAMLAWNLAQNRLVHAVNQAFGSDGAAVKHIITIDEVAFAVGQDPNGASQAAVDGDTATITTQIPALVLAIAPADFQPILRNWSNKKLYFHKQADQWKFDIDHSMRVVAKVFDRQHRPLDSAARIIVMMEFAKATDQVADAVSNGRMDTSNDAAAAANSSISKIERAHGISGWQMDIVPLNGGK